MPMRCSPPSSCNMIWDLQRQDPASRVRPGLDTAKSPKWGAWTQGCRCLCLGVVVGPGFLEPMGKIFYRLRLLLAAEHEKSGRRRTQPTHCPHNLLHSTPLSLGSCKIHGRLVALSVWMQSGALASANLMGARPELADKLGDMDRVRLGRALGYGTRHAAKTVAAMVEAAASPASTNSGEAGREIPTQPVVEPAPQDAFRERPARTRDVSGGLKQLKRSVWQPLAVFSGALWLRVTGVFFAMIAFTVGAGAWRLRAGWERVFATAASTRFWVFLAVAVMFAYFAVSSFVRANRMERRAAASR